MNHIIFEGEWKQIRGQAKVWWGKLTNINLEQVGGKFQKLIGFFTLTEEEKSQAGIYLGGQGRDE